MKDPNFQQICSFHRYAYQLQFYVKLSDLHGDICVYYWHGIIQSFQTDLKS